MRLFLASEAKNPKTIAKLREYIGGFAGKKIAYIPTAANGENPFGSWQHDSDTWQLIQTLGAKVTAVQLEDYKHQSIARDLENKDVIWFAGGYCGYLMYWIRRTQLDKFLPKLLKKSLYVGSSAGSMIAAKSLQVAEIFPHDSEPGANLIPGLGLVDFEILPHYSFWMKPFVKKYYHGKKLYLLKNGEEIIIEDKKVIVVGQERIVSQI